MQFHPRSVKGAFCAFFCFWALLGHAQSGFDNRWSTRLAIK
jgi:hypothetical protein